MIASFQIPYDAAMESDLRRRLRDTRWADAVTDDWSMGTELSFLTKLVDFWISKYDWAERVRRFNELPHFLADIDQCSVHFLHYRSGSSDAIPLLLLNGWPSSFLEYGRIVDGLLGGTPAFDLVIPTMPGFGYSERPRRPYEFEFADLFPRLMQMLGYDRYMVSGTDIGSGTATRIALKYPDRVMAVHVSAIPSKPRNASTPAPTNEELAYQERVNEWYGVEGGYQAIQNSKPQTLAFALADSPVGLASWITEKYRSWSDCGGDLTSVWPLETLVDTIMIYWATNTIGSSIRYYYDATRLRPGLKDDAYISAPTAVTMWPADIALAPRAMAERLYNVRRYSVQTNGGHFPAWEVPELYAMELRALADEIGPSSR